jgi:hypothetical protein
VAAVAIFMRRTHETTKQQSLLLRDDSGDKVPLEVHSIAIVPLVAGG